jgi:uncharacterized membrane protein
MIDMKKLVWLSFAVFSILGSWIGELIGGGWLGMWSMSLGTLGCVVGIWVGYKVGKNL